MSVELCKKALEIKKSGLWDIFMEEQIFALKLPKQDIVFVQVCRNDSDEKNITVYYGEESLEMARRLLDTRMETMADDEEALHLEAMIEGAELVFTNKDELTDLQRVETKSAADELGTKLRGSGAFPAYSRLKRGCDIEPLKDPSDEKIMDAAIDAALWFIKDQVGIVRLFIPAASTGAFDMPLLEYSRGKFKRSFISIPALPKMKYPAGSACNEILQKRLKRMKKKGSWCCRLVRMTKGYTWSGGDEMVLPVKLRTINPAINRSVEVMPVAFYEERTDVVLDKFMEAITVYGSCPVNINVMDDRTYRLLERWCKNCGIKLIRQEYIPELDLPEDLFAEGFDTDEMIREELDMMDLSLSFLLDLSDDELKKHKEELKSVREMKEYSREYPFPLEIQRKLDKIVKRIDKLDK